MRRLSDRIDARREAPRTPSRGLSAALGVACLALTAAGHVHGHLVYLDGMDTRRTLYTPAPPRRDDSVPVPAGVRRLVVLVLDGLRDDVADTLPPVRALAARGVRRTLRAEFPTFTFASLTTMATGVPPFYSGVRLNSGSGHVRLDTLFDAASRAGVPSRVVPGDFERFPRALDRRNATRLRAMTLAEFAARAPEREIAWIHFDAVDAAGHHHGAASQEYRAAAREAGRMLAAVAALVDPARDALVALSDHGHRDRGGHGGTEPEVVRAFFLAYGRGVARGLRLPPRRMRDVSPTLAMLLGIAPPRDGLGVPMLDLLAATPADRARALAPAWVQRAHADAVFAPATLDRGDVMDTARALAAGDAARVDPARAALEARDRARHEELRERWWRRARGRLVVAGGILLALLGALALAAGRRVLELHPRDAVPTGVFAGAYTLVYVAFGYALSWSIPRDETHFIVETAIAGVVAGLAAVVAGRTRVLRAAGPARAAEQAVVMLLALGGAYLLAAAWAGVDPAWLAGPRASFLVVFLATAVFYAGVAFGLAALASAVWRRPGST